MSRIITPSPRAVPLAEAMLRCADVHGAAAFLSCTRADTPSAVRARGPYLVIELEQLAGEVVVVAPRPVRILARTSLS